MSTRRKSPARQATEAKVAAARAMGDANHLGFSNRRKVALTDAAARVRRAAAGGSGRVTPKADRR